MVLVFFIAIFVQEYTGGWTILTATVYNMYVFIHTCICMQIYFVFIIN